MEKWSDFEVAVCVNKEVWWFQVSVDYIGRVHVFQATQRLINEIADVFIRERLLF